MEEYVGNNFPDFLPGAAYNLLAEGTKRTARRNVAILDRWIAQRFGDDVAQVDQNPADALVALGAVRPTISIGELVCFMMYRVAGERLSADIHSGSVALSTFLASDLSPMITLLAHQGRVMFSYADFKQSQEFRDCAATCRKLRGEVTAFSSARPIYPQDEKLLRSCLSMDTASKRDEFIIILALRAGFRTKSLSLIRLDLHVREVTAGALEIILPGCKTTRLMDFRQILTGEDFVVAMRWIVRRRQIYQGSPYLFVSRNGTQISCDSVTMMLSDLSICAGYGRGFFSSHSFRVGYASRVAAECFAAGQTTEDVYQRLCDGHRWARKSGRVCKYIDPNLKGFFREGLGMNLEQFLASSPALVHGLGGLGEPGIRPLNWFCNPDFKLIQICRTLGLTGTQKQEDVRFAVGRALFCLDQTIREFVIPIQELSGKSMRRILEELVGCLLEDEVADIGRVYVSPFKEELSDCLIVDKAVGGHVQTAHRAQKTVIHKLRDRFSTEQLLHNIRIKRIYDRKVHLGILPNDQLVLMRSREIEESCREAQLPVLDLDVHFPVEGRHQLLDM